MKKLFVLFVSALLVLGVVTNADAFVSSPIQDGNYTGVQEFVIMFNNTTRIIASNTIVTLDLVATTTDVAVNARGISNLGAFASQSSVTGAAAVIGVADEDIATGTYGRICVRGPHQVKFRVDGAVIGTIPEPTLAGDWVISGGLIGQGAYPVGSGKRGLGFAISASQQVATLPTHGSVVGFTMRTANTGASSSGSDLIWIWVQPGPHTPGISSE